MKWKELMRRKRLLFSIVAVATLATSFVLYATMNTTNPPISDSTSKSALPTETHGGEVLQAFGISGSGTPSGSFTPKHITGNSQDRQGTGRADFEAVFNDGSSSIQLADNFDVDSGPSTNTDAEQFVQGIGGKGSGTAPDDFTKILLANNDYPKHDHDFQAFGSHVSNRGGGPESIAPDRSSDNLNESKASDSQTSHAPEPASMLLLGTALVGVAVFGRKLKNK